ncbi:GntR family transcriptional regulator [Reyranella soli]|uniref:GntR family transcriptional regulator n=1 Tax=Reyranella soli TaxID=1230389 RepID=A0A512NIG0_9HYPH|nr:GntR family transcriptional regulator [Reyranella soli]GEP58741.1 GntR family transcriptional regulator [Reyranella soli]
MSDTSLRTQVYDSLRQALTTGRFAPGQKLTFRFIAGALGVSLTPVREALGRLVAEGAFEMQPNRSVRVPLMTRARIEELRDIRKSLEGLATAKAAMVADKRQIAELRRIALAIATARSHGDDATDRQHVREFHFSLYGIAGQPILLRVIEGLWLQTGPYMNLLYPDFINRPHGPQTRARIIRAMQARDAVAARREIENDIDRALSYIAELADDAGNIAPAAPKAGVGRRRGTAMTSLQFDYVQ